MAGEETSNTSDINRQTDTSQRTPGSGVLGKELVNANPIRHSMYTNFVNLIVVQIGAIWNVFSAHLVVHVCLDPTRSDDVASDLLITEV